MECSNCGEAVRSSLMKMDIVGLASLMQNPNNGY